MELLSRSVQPHMRPRVASGEEVGFQSHFAPLARPYTEGSPVIRSHTDSTLQFLEHTRILHLFGFSHGPVREARWACYSHFTDGNMEAQRCERSPETTELPWTTAGLELGPSDSESRNPFFVLRGC